MGGFSVIIATYNKAEIVLDCLESIIKADRPRCAVEVIVIDNNSTDDTIERVGDFIGKNRSPGDIDIRLLREGRQGLVYCRNRGITDSTGELLFYLDDDAIISKGCLAAYWRYYVEMGYLCLGGKILPWYRDDPEVPRWFNESNWGVLSMLDRGDAVKAVKYPDYPYGGNLVIARSLFDKYGPFDEKMGRKGKSLNSNMEIDFMLRLERAGEPIYYVPDATIYHLVPEGRLTRGFFFRRLYAQGASNAYLFTKERGIGWGLLSIPGELFGLVKSPLRYIKRTLSRRDDSFRALMQTFYHIGFIKKTIGLAIGKVFRPKNGGTS
jgi:glycosyltransferase involved in cell wall biosynthesis